MPEGNDDLLRNLSPLVEGAKSLTSWVDKLVARWTPINMEVIRKDPFRMVGRAVIVRQASAIRSTVVLAENGLGHAALPMVRPACDELIWLSYLCSLEEAQRTALLLLLHDNEGARTVMAQQQHLGSRTMRGIGFPKAFVRSMETARKVTEDLLVALGKTLAWPESGSVPPGAAWLASQVSLSKLHAFLYSATSKGVHFSVMECFRSGYNDGTPDGPITVGAPIYTAYRSAFTLMWQCELLIRTLAAVSSTMPEFGGDDLDDGDGYIDAVERVAKYGKVPIVMPSEFNLPDRDHVSSDGGDC